MRILVTGATGFIGGRLCKKLAEAGHQVLGTGRRGIRKQIHEVGFASQFSNCTVHCELESYFQVRELMNNFQPEVVYHLAGNPIVKEDPNFPCDITKANVLTTHHLLATCPLNTKFVFASSATVYGDYQGKPFTEDDTPNPTSVYGVTKWASEQLVEVFRKQGRVRAFIARLIANCGSGASHGVFHDIIQKLRSTSQNLNLFGDEPGTCKPYLHVDSTVNALCYLGIIEKKEGIYNVSTNDSITIKELAEMVMDVTGMRKPINWMGNDYIWQGDNRIVKVSSRLFGQETQSINEIAKAAHEEIL